jgi:hypothetical protein
MNKDGSKATISYIGQIDVHILNYAQILQVRERPRKLSTGTKGGHCPGTNGHKMQTWKAGIPLSGDRLRVAGFGVTSQTGICNEFLPLARSRSVVPVESIRESDRRD